MAVGGGIVFIVLVTLFCCCYCKCKNRTKKTHHNTKHDFTDSSTEREPLMNIHELDPEKEKKRRKRDEIKQKYNINNK